MYVFNDAVVCNILLITLSLEPVYVFNDAVANCIDAVAWFNLALPNTSPPTNIEPVNSCLSSALSPNLFEPFAYKTDEDNIVMWYSFAVRVSNLALIVPSIKSESFAYPLVNPCEPESINSSNVFVSSIITGFVPISLLVWSDKPYLLIYACSCVVGIWFPFCCPILF